jgi:DNA-binding PadR family transcriptional regulator
MPPKIDQTGPFPDQAASHADGQEQPSATRRSNPTYELFVLGELMGGPQYGYKLNDIINRILGPQQQLSWGTLYPLIRRLEREGLTIATAEQRQAFPPVERGQPRRTYAITEAGRQRFFELMLRPPSYTYHPDLFAVQLTKFAWLTPVQRLVILRRYQTSLCSLRDFYQKMRLRIEMAPELCSEERPFILQLIDYRIHLLNAELTWFERTIVGASKEGLDLQETAWE